MCTIVGFIYYATECLIAKSWLRHSADGPYRSFPQAKGTVKSRVKSRTREEAACSPDGIQIRED